MFFFSSRRRHTRYIGDWSSDVCSSDLPARILATLLRGRRQVSPRKQRRQDARRTPADRRGSPALRSEERRVGKECTCTGGPARSIKSTSALLVGEQPARGMRASGARL